jgi:hypothetical protein
MKHDSRSAGSAPAAKLGAGAGITMLFGAIAVLYFARDILIPFRVCPDVDVSIDSRSSASPKAARGPSRFRSGHGPGHDRAHGRHRLDHRSPVG